MAKISRNRMFVSHLKKFQSKIKLDTQKIRKKTVEKLKDLFILANEQAKNRHLDLSERQKWVYIAGYLAQVMNRVANSFDESFINDELKRLEDMVNEAVAKGKDQGIKTEASGPAGS